VSIRENDVASAALMTQDGSAEWFGCGAVIAPRVILPRSFGVEWGIIRTPYVREHRALDQRAPAA
jgi:hypothetical protein